MPSILQRRWCKRKWLKIMILKSKYPRQKKKEVEISCHKKNPTKYKCRIPSYHLWGLQILLILNIDFICKRRQFFYTENSVNEKMYYQKNRKVQNSRPFEKLTKKVLIFILKEEATEETKQHGFTIAPQRKRRKRG